MDVNDILNDFNGLINSICMIVLIILTWWGMKKEDNHRKHERGRKSRDTDKT
jgi:hypothetical protein